MALICRTRCIVYIQSTAEPYAVRNTFYYRVCMYAMMHTSTHAHQRISHLAQVVHLCITCTDVAHQDHLYMVYTCATQRPLDLSCMPGASEPQRPVPAMAVPLFHKKIFRKLQLGAIPAARFSSTQVSRRTKLSGSSSIDTHEQTPVRARVRNVYVYTHAVRACAIAITNHA